jgi:hypothetical protein
LGRLLLTVLARLGYDRVAADELRLVGGGEAWPTTNPYRRLHALADDPVADGVRWGDVGCTYLPALDKRLVRLEHVAARFRPGTGPPAGSRSDRSHTPVHRSRTRLDDRRAQRRTR